MRHGPVVARVRVHCLKNDGNARAKALRVGHQFTAVAQVAYERHLRGNVAYDTYLTGADAKARYVTTNQAALVSK